MRKKFKFWCKGTSPHHNFNKPGWWAFDDSIISRHYGLDIFESAHFEVYQSTETTDRDGVEIWEGDILEYQSGEIYAKKGVVVFEKGAFVFSAIKTRNGFIPIYAFSKSTSGGLRVLKVIGNKFDHPELLKQCVNYWETA